MMNHKPEYSDADDDATQFEELRSLTDMLDVLEKAAEQSERMSLGKSLDLLGRHSFTPLLLLPGLIMAVPGPADIPGVPIVLGFVIIVIAVQMVLRREHLWVPHWIEKRKVESETVAKMIRWVRRPAGWLDRLTKERFAGVLNHGGYTAIAIACILIAASTPVLEFIPMSANVAGIAIVAFGLSLMAKDGLLAGIAMLFVVSVVTLISYKFL